MLQCCPMRIPMKDCPMKDCTSVASFNSALETGNALQRARPSASSCCVGYSGMEGRPAVATMGGHPRPEVRTSTCNLPWHGRASDIQARADVQPWRRGRPLRARGSNLDVQLPPARTSVRYPGKVRRPAVATRVAPEGPSFKPRSATSSGTDERRMFGQGPTSSRGDEGGP